MRIAIRNCKNPRTKARAKLALQFMLKRVLPTLHQNISTTITFKKIDAFGYLHWTDDKGRRFHMEINVWRPRWLQTIAHECIHIRQYALGMLDGGHTRWKKSRVVEENRTYMELPWEREAFAMQDALLHEFLEYEKTLNDQK